MCRSGFTSERTEFAINRLLSPDAFLPNKRGLIWDYERTVSVHHLFREDEHFVNVKGKWYAITCKDWSRKVDDIEVCWGRDVSSVRDCESPKGVAYGYTTRFLNEGNASFLNRDDIVTHLKEHLSQYDRL